MFDKFKQLTNLDNLSNLGDLTNIDDYVLEKFQDFKQLKNLSIFDQQKLLKEINVSALQEKFSSGLFRTVESVFDKQKNDPTVPGYTENDVDIIIKKYAKQNMILAAASSIVPGPLGILGAIPELLLNMKNQMGMIYDLGSAFDKEDFINKDLLLDIPIAAFGGNTNLAKLQSNTKDLVDSPQDMLMSKATDLGKGIINRQLKKSVVQFIPIAGPIMMGIWAKMTTAKISKASVKFLDRKDNYIEHVKKEETPEIERALQIEKIKGLTNLIEANNDINEVQIAFIGPIIQNADLQPNEKEYYLEQALKPGSNFQLDYQLLKDYEEDDVLLMEMIILAKRTGIVDELERAYIMKIAGEMKADEALILDMLE